LDRCGRFGGVEVVGLHQSLTVSIGSVAVIFVVGGSGKSVVDISVGVLIMVVIVLSRIAARRVVRTERWWGRVWNGL
jgi:hypothetical protein